MTTEHDTNGWHSRTPTKIALDDLTDRELELLVEDDHFCMLPWIHMHGYPDGRAYPCCDSVYQYPIGDFNESSMEEVWNNDAMKEIRYNMLNKIDCKQCQRCYDKEAHGVYTMRNSTNKHFGHHIKEVLPATHDDGTLDVFKFRYYDIRFSNLCNMKCRTCGDDFSSLWADENKKRFEWAIDVPKVRYSGRSETDMLEQLDDHIPYVEQIYFAGGEPLIMPEHYKLVRKLIERERFDVQLTYNTNFSKIEYGKHNILSDWKLFDSVSVGASLDAEGARGEYMRKGTKWDTIVRNRELMLEICPKVDFYLSPTVGLFNVLTVCDFHRNWTEKKLIEASNFHLNMLYGPEDRRADVLPAKLKLEAREKIKEHIMWLKTQDRNAQQRCIPEFKALLTMMYDDDKSHLIPEFFRINDPLDEWREESFDDVFPELNEMRKYQ
jgi:radical SAM protein with 4Fe4S-binding SPASM domain